MRAATLATAALPVASAAALAVALATAAMMVTGGRVGRGRARVTAAATEQTGGASTGATVQTMPAAQFPVVPKRTMAPPPHDGFVTRRATGTQESETPNEQF